MASATEESLNNCSGDPAVHPAARHKTQLCKVRGTSDTFVGRAYSMFHLEYEYGFCELNLRYDY